MENHHKHSKIFSRPEFSNEDRQRKEKGSPYCRGCLDVYDLIQLFRVPYMTFLPQSMNEIAANSSYNRRKHPP